jgi:hypothetical protein
MATTIKLKNSVTTTAAPSTLVQGEVATNITDKKVWVGDASSTPVQILGAGATVAGTTGTFTGNVSVAGTFAANGGATLGDASGDALTINSSAVSIPNGLTFSGGTTTFSNNQIISVTDNSNAALRITQLGTGNALVVEDSTNPDSTPFVVDTNGNVLLGITTRRTVGLTNQLQVEGTSADSSAIGITRNAASTGAGYLIFGKSRGAATGSVDSVLNGDQLGRLAWYGADGTSFVNAANIISEVDGTPGTNDMPGRLVFSTTADGASSPTERMRIGSNGTIGIGTSNIAAATLSIGKTLTGATATYGILQSGQVQSDVTSVNYGFLGQLNTQATTFTLANQRHFAATQGTLGAGSTVTTQVGFFAASSLTGATNNYGFYGDIASGTGRYNFYAAGTADNYFAGNVGIGVTTPSAKVHILTGTATGVSAGTGSRLFIDGANANNWIDIASTTTGEVGIRLGDADGVQRGRIGYQNTSDVLDFYTAGSERMRIDSSGNLLVGKTSATANGGDIQVSKGITFPATQSAQSDANTLDDYEEGTWTPTVRGGSTAGTYTPSSVRAYYTKIGNQVTCWGGFGFSAASGGSGIIILDGFPFSYKGSSAITAPLNTISLNTSASSSNGIAISNTTSAAATTFYVFLNIDNSAQEEVSIGAVSTSTQLQFTVTYTVSN